MKRTVLIGIVLTIAAILLIMTIVLKHRSKDIKSTVRTGTPSVMIVGDSLISGVIFMLKLNVALPGWDTYTGPYPGENPRDLLGRIGNFASHDYTVVVSGANGLVDNCNAIVYLSKVYEILSKSGSKVIAVTLHNWGGYDTWNGNARVHTHTFNKWLLLKPDYVDHVIDTRALFNEGTPSDNMKPGYTSDGLHFNDAGKTAFVSNIKAVVTKMEEEEYGKRK